MKTYQAGFMREAELADLGAAAVGDNVAVHRSCVLVGLEAMRFGSNVRIDAFTLLSAAGGWLTIGDFVHVGAQCLVQAGSGVEIADFAGLSAGVKVFSRSDDYSGEYLTNPTVPPSFAAQPAQGAVRIGRHVIVGAGSIILPKVDIGDGSSVGAMSLVNRSLDGGGVYAGAPAKHLGNRRQDIVHHENRLRAAIAAGQVELPVAGL